MIMNYLAIAAAAATALIGAASAQDTTAAFSQYCESDVRAQGYSEKQALGGCACGAGVLGGLLDARQWDVLGRLLPGMKSQEQMGQIIQGLLAEGYSQQDILSIGQVMTSSSERITRVCSFYEGAGGNRSNTVSLKSEVTWDDVLINEPAKGADAMLTGFASQVSAGLDAAMAAKSAK